MPNAYTLGNPVVYDDLLENSNLEKQPGGAVFWTLEGARDALVVGRFGTYLPREWFPDAGPIPGAVYGLRVNSNDVGDEQDVVGAYTLLNPARITGKIE